MTGPSVDRASLSGHRSSRLGRSPFGATVPSVVAAVVFGVVAVVWVAAGGGLPGGRWLAVHLFTLGVVTNLVLAFTEHFGRTLTRQPATSIVWQTWVVNIGVVAVLIGLPAGIRWLVAVGATVVTAVVCVSYVRLRRMRRQAVGARFGWIVRVYERAHGAFVHGAILGVLMGIGVLRGPWYVAARTAHLHVNILGWAGLTLLATLVFFGPTMARTRIVEGSDDRAARAVRLGATGVTVGALLLLATGVGGTAAVVFRVAAAVAIGVFGWAVTVTCRAVAVAARRANGSAARWPVVALNLWFPVAVWADVAVIVTGAWRWLDVVGLSVLLGVLAQAMAAVMTYLAPMFRGRRFAGRDRLLARFERAAGARTVAYNVGVGAVVLAAVIGGPAGAAVAVAGWTLMIATLSYLLLAGIVPIRLPADATSTPPVSQVARRYRKAKAEEE